MTRIADLKPAQIRKLDECVRGLQDVNPAQAAAELSELMRAYGLRSWRGRSLRGLAVQANTLVNAADIYHAGRQWRGPHRDPGNNPSYWTAGHRIVALFTPSREQALVLRHWHRPVFMAPQRDTGLHSMPTVPADDRREMLGVRIEVHTHKLPCAIYPHAELWDRCCTLDKTRQVDRKAELTMIEFLKTKPPVLSILDALLKIWCEVHGTAKASWRHE